MSCSNEGWGEWCNGHACGSEGTDWGCQSDKCEDGKCVAWDGEDAAGLALGIIILIIVCVVIPCCAIGGCIICCVMGVGFCAKKGAEAAAAQ